MIDLYYWPTPNGQKISIALEEMGLPYNVCPVNIGRGDQFKPEFLKISPNNRMPAIVDHDAEGGPLSIFESGAILLYLGEKSGQFLPKDLHGRFDVMQWLMWQMGGLGPMSGQASHFVRYAPERIQYAMDRYSKEVNRLHGVMNIHLKDREFLAGAYSIADMASYPWVVGFEEAAGGWVDMPNLKRWVEVIRRRPAVERGMAVGKDLRRSNQMDDDAKKILFGQTARKE